MPAYMVVNVYLREAEWVADYVANVPAIIRKYGGDYLAVSSRLQKFEGEGPIPNQVALFTFPSLDAIDKFMNSDEYKPYKELRLAQSSAEIVGFEP